MPPPCPISLNSSARWGPGFQLLRSAKGPRSSLEGTSSSTEQAHRPGRLLALQGRSAPGVSATPGLLENMAGAAAGQQGHGRSERQVAKQQSSPSRKTAPGGSLLAHSFHPEISKLLWSVSTRRSTP